uniref:Uncharacterized protein n=1 Tax=Oryza meridionalis TaxID=40149 RepID=A0A0E0CQ10_9ORYZ
MSASSLLFSSLSSSLSFRLPDLFSTSARLQAGGAAGKHAAGPLWISRVERPPLQISRWCAYTVWKRSSIGFQGTDGFSVYDSAGKLVFRVDN